MTARNTMEAATWAAIAKHRKAIADGTWQKTADNALVDAVLKAADVYALGAAASRKKHQVNAAALDAALASIRATETFGDVPGVQAERRQVLDAYAVRKKAAG